MSHPSAPMIRDCIKRLQAGYCHIYGTLQPAYADLLGEAASISLSAIARSDAPYHNVEHTILVALVGQEILRGKQQVTNVDCRDWAHFIISLLCHDVGYVKGICQQDNIAERLFATGVNDERVAIALDATDASLTPYHVDRSKQFVEETFAHQPLLDRSVIQRNIELTRFPGAHQQSEEGTDGYADLARAADLIGQLSDPHYLEKIPALFCEFAEVGTHRVLGYAQPKDLRAGYPAFFYSAVYPHIRQALQYLNLTHKGRQIVKNLYTNVSTVEKELLHSVHCSHRTNSVDFWVETISDLFDWKQVIKTA